MEFIKLAQQRYSCRKLSDRPVEAEKVETLLAAAMAAPTAVNKQPFKIWVCRDAEKIAAATPYTFGAQVFFIVGADRDAAWVRRFDGKNFADVDAAIAATHMILAVEDLSLGTTWVGHFDAEKLKELFPQMHGFELIAIFPVGYPAADAEPSPRHAECRPREELVEYL